MANKVRNVQIDGNESLFKIRPGTIFRYANGAADHFYIRTSTGVVSLKSGDFFSLGDRPGLIEAIKSGGSLTIDVE